MDLNFPLFLRYAALTTKIKFQGEQGIFKETGCMPKCLRRKYDLKIRYQEQLPEKDDVVGFEIKLNQSINQVYQILHLA